MHLSQSKIPPKMFGMFGSGIKNLGFTNKLGPSKTLIPNLFALTCFTIIRFRLFYMIIEIL
ncbi:hypothetical protein BpHYR1_010562 [Brachionus plicatilis]|uniref:Uncharacterized protein n=1 Tax=Brachionus plicatilis TaxID=10195 RepID=A0A3M7T8K4_BRAPC|nr:hypothetical protein BpHYR1_010562 [Brachionus plicatilis]